MPGPLSTYYKLRMANPQVQLPGQAPLYMPNNNQQQPVDNAMQQPQQQQQPQEQPQIDTNDPINSLAGMLVTPAEREAQEQKMLRNKRRMIAWTGLFDGLRNLANLYAVSKGAAPMKFTDNPYQQLDQSYQEEKQRQEGIYQNRDKYAKSLYDLYRQGQQDKIKEESHKAQMEWYKNRDEMAQRKQELAEFKAKTDADYKKATLEQKNAINEVKIRLMEGQINKTEADRQYRLIMMGKQAGGGKSGGGGNTEMETVEWMDDQGRKHKKTTRKKTSSGGGGGSLLPKGKGSSTKSGGSLLPK